MKLTDEDQEWLRSRGPTGHEADVAAAIARGYERGHAEARAYIECAEAKFASVVADRDRLAKRCEDLVREMDAVRLTAAGERKRAAKELTHGNDRLAALEQRVGALVEALMTQDWSSEEFEDRLAALRSPGVATGSESDRCRQAAQRLIEIVGADGPMSLEDVVGWVGGRVEAVEAALATARRERDEAVSVVRRCAVGLGDPCKRDCSHDACWVISEARALVAGQGMMDRRR